MSTTDKSDTSLKQRQEAWDQFSTHVNEQASAVSDAERYPQMVAKERYDRISPAVDAAVISVEDEVKRFDKVMKTVLDKHRKLIEERNAALLRAFQKELSVMR